MRGRSVRCREQLPVPRRLKAKDVAAGELRFLVFEDIGGVNARDQHGWRVTFEQDIRCERVVAPVWIPSECEGIGQWSPWDRWFGYDLFQASSAASCAGCRLKGTILIGEKPGGAMQGRVLEVIGKRKRKRRG